MLLFAKCKYRTGFFTPAFLVVPKKEWQSLFVIKKNRNHDTSESELHTLKTIKKNRNHDTSESELHDTLKTIKKIEIMNTIIKLLTAIIRMPGKIGDKIIRLQEIISKLTNNTYFPTGWVAGGLTQAQFTADVNAFIAAETSVRNRVAGAVGTRNAAYSTIKADLLFILSMVQNKANANLNNAATIIGSAGFFVKNYKGATKKQNAAYNTQVLGTVTLTADGAGHHEWQMSKDQVNITNLPATTGAETQVHGLTTGDVWYFRSRKVNNKKTTYNWCAWIQLKIGAGGKNLGGGNTSHNVSGNLPTA